MIRSRATWVAFFVALWVSSPRTCQAVSLESLLRVPGATITADDKIFTDWNLLVRTTTNGGLANLDQVEVTPLIDDPLDPGLKFSAPVGALGTPFGHQGPSSVHVEFSFNVRTANQLPLIKDNSLLINGWVFDSGPLASIQIAENIFDASGAPLGDKLAIVRPNDAPGDPNHFDTAVFAPQAFLHVVKIIDIQGPGTNDGAFLTMFEQRFSQIPEPSSVTLAALALACIAVGVARRRL